jgi:hypothetical protein
MADDIEQGSKSPQLTNEQRTAMLAKLDEEIASDEAQLRAQAQAQTGDTARTETKQSESAPTAETASEGREDAAQQKPSEGRESLEKIQEDIKHLEKGIEETAEEKERLSKMSHEEKVAHFLKVRQDKRREYTQGRQKLSEERKTVIPADTPPQQPVYSGDLTPELKTTILVDLEKDPVGTIDRLLEARVNLALDRKVRPVVSEWEAERTRSADRREAEELAGLAKENPWMLTEGLARFERVFEANPWLRQSPNPYKDAIRFMDDLPSRNGMAPGLTQAGSPLPVLGSSGAIPPSTLDRSATVESSYNDLERQYDLAIRERRFRDADKIGVKIEKLLAR